MTLKTQLEGRLKGIGYKDGNYIRFDRLVRILKSLRYVYIHNVDKRFSVLVGHEDKDRFPKDVRIISITEGSHHIWDCVVGYIPDIEVSVTS